jgi:hypothetical protein
MDGAALDEEQDEVKAAFAKTKLLSNRVVVHTTVQRRSVMVTIKVG